MPPRWSYESPVYIIWVSYKDYDILLYIIQLTLHNYYYPEATVTFQVYTKATTTADMQQQGLAL